MAYSADVIRRALNRLESKKTDRASVQRAREQEIYEKLPRVRQIDKQLAGSMALAVQAAFAKGRDGTAALAQVREANLALQAERKNLIAANFPLEYLADGPMCPLCQDNGYIGATMCRCLQELCRQEQKKELTFLNVGREAFDQFRLDYYPDRVDPKWGVNIRTVMEKTFQTCRKYALTFNEKSGNLLFSGDTGLGKTFLSACIARAVADRGYSVVYESAGHLFANLERAKFDNDEAAKEDSRKYTACDLLIIDDLGTEMPSQFVTAALYALVNDRLLAGQAMIISTNLNTEDMTRRYNPQIASRLRGSFTRVAFLGDDIRVKKNWGM